MSNVVWQKFALTVCAAPSRARQTINVALLRSAMSQHKYVWTARVSWLLMPASLCRLIAITMGLIVDHALGQAVAIGAMLTRNAREERFATARHASQTTL